MTAEYEIFKEHGITAGLNCLTMRIQELAMAVNLQGVHHAVAQYGSTVVSHGGHELYVMTKPAEALWNESKHMAIHLPSSASTADERLESMRQLGEAVDYLTTLLEEGQPS